jgi:5-(carboxyamino)imidazole ribonucleotide mutase
MIVPIIMGSKEDMEFSKKIGEELDKLGIKYEYRIASAHKATEFVLAMVKEYDSKDDKIVYITVAGRSNALSGVVDANTDNPVIACPPYSEKYKGLDVLSSLRMPSGVCPAVVLEPKNAALLAAKILGMTDRSVREKLNKKKKEMADSIKKADSEARS